MNNIELRARKFDIMKQRSHPAKVRYDHYHELHLEQARVLADRQHAHMQMHTLELLVQSRRHSNALEKLLEATLAAAPEQQP